MCPSPHDCRPTIRDGRGAVSFTDDGVGTDTGGSDDTGSGVVTRSDRGGMGGVVREDVTGTARGIPGSTVSVVGVGTTGGTPVTVSCPLVQLTPPSPTPVPGVGRAKVGVG